MIYTKMTPGNGEKIIFKPIFIVGVPRSGTTLLQSLLSASPDAYSLPETHFFSTIMPRISKANTDLLGLSNLSQILSLIERYMDLKLSASTCAILKKKSHDRSLTGKEVFEILLEWYAQHEDTEKKLRVIEKTPLHLLHMVEIASLYDDALFIQIVRDPRNAISSVLDTAFVNSRCLPWHAQRWNYFILMANRFMDTAPKRFISIRYEDLVDFPERTVLKVCEFAGIRFEQQMLLNFEYERKRNTLAQKEPWKTPRNPGIITQDNRAWRKRLSAPKHGPSSAIPKKT